MCIESAGKERWDDDGAKMKIVDVNDLEVLIEGVLRESDLWTVSLVFLRGRGGRWREEK